MTRLTIALATVGLLGTAGTAFAQQADLAAKENEEGKQLVYDGKNAEASAKFRSAVARVPEPKYFFNLCGSLFSEGKFSEAMTACDSVGKNNPAADLSAKTQKLQDRITLEAKAQNVTLVPTGGGGGDPNQNPDPNNQPGPGPGPGPGPNQGPPPQQYQQAVGRPPTSQGLFTATKSDNRYTWTLGADIFGGGGTIGRKDVYGTAEFGIRIKSDYLINPESRIGASAWLQYSQFTKGDEQVGTGATGAGLTIMDLGVGVYKDLCVGESLCLRPLVGVELAFMSPEFDDDMDDGTKYFNYTAGGARAELEAHFAFGSRLEHVLGVGVGVNAYTAVFSESSDALYTKEQVGLDKGGVAGYLSIGYTYRFNTPLGGAAFVTLE